MIDFSKTKFRCSSLGKLMTNKQGKTDTKSIDELSETAIQELVKVYVKERYGRDKEIQSKYIEKGLQVEEDSITLLSRLYMIPLFKNDKRMENDFITGEADITDPWLKDLKSCWDLHTFMAHKTSKLNKVYEYQINGYCDLYNFNEGSVAFCLIDTPLGLIEDEKRRLLYKMNVASSENTEYLEACAELEKEMMFMDIPLKQRVHEVVVKKSPALMESVYKRVPIWREFLEILEAKEYPVVVPQTVTI